MRRPPPRPTPTDTRFPYTTRFRYNDPARLQQVEDMARLNGLILGGERKVFLDAALALGFGIAEPFEKLFSVSDLKIPCGKLALVFEEYIAIGQDRKSTRLNSSH